MATDREVFLDTVRHSRPERVLYHFGCTPDLDRRLSDHVGGDGDYRRHYGCFRPWGLSPKRPADLAPLDFSRYWDGEDLPPGTRVNMNGVAEVPSGFYHFTGYISPLRNATDLREIEEFPIDDLAGFDCSQFAGSVASARAEGRAVSAWAGHMYETAWQIRGYEQFLMDMAERPAWAECLLDRLSANNLVRAVEAAKAGADAIYCGDDVANQRALMFSPGMWRRFMLPRWESVWRAARGVKPDIVVHYHSDGNVEAVVPELVEAGLDVLNPVQPECLDADAVHARFGGRLSFDGCIGTQTTMPFGSPDDVRRRVRECIARYGREGGLIVSPTHVLEPEVPIANIEAMVEAARGP
jgi:uroporphyrinogen decarboxylase